MHISNSDMGETSIFSQTNNILRIGHEYRKINRREK